MFAVHQGKGYVEQHIVWKWLRHPTQVFAGHMLNKYSKGVTLSIMQNHCQGPEL